MKGSLGEKPACLAGTPIRPEGPPGWPVLDEAVRDALEKAYRDGTWGHYFGPNVRELEARLTAYFGTEYALPCSSGTLAVEIALRAVNVRPGDEVIMAGYDYLGNFLSIHALEAMPVLVDIAPHHWNLGVDRVADAISPRTRAILISHLHGGIVDMPALMDLAHARGIPVIEDAAQMPGASLAGKKLAGFGHVGIVSFGGSKLLSAGRGGALLTSEAKIFQKARAYVQRGNNALVPLSELQATVLLPQLTKLDERTRLRAENVGWLEDRLKHIPGLRMFANLRSDLVPGYYKLGFQFDADLFGLSRRSLVQAIRAEGIAFDEGFSAVHVGRSPSRYKKGDDLRTSEHAHRATLVLHHPVLLGTRSDLEQVGLALEKILRFAGEIRALEG